MQGSSLTEGKRSKRNKKNENGDGRSSPKSDDSDSDKLKSALPSKAVWINFAECFFF